MSLYIYHKNLTKSLRRQHRLWILTPFFWALPDFRVGPSNSSSHRRFGSNLWLETRWSIWVSKLQPNGDYKERQTPFAVPLQGHVPASSDWLCLELCVGCTATVSSIPWCTDNLPRTRHCPLPTKLCLLTGVRIPPPPPERAWRPTGSPPKFSSQRVLGKRREGRKRGKLASYRLLSLSHSSTHNLPRKAFATELLHQEEQLEHSSLNQTKRSTPACNTAELQCSLVL